MSHTRAEIVSVSTCGCKVLATDDNTMYQIAYCPLHKAAPALRAELKQLTVALKLQQAHERMHGQRDADGWTPLIQSAEATIAQAEGKA